MRIPFPAGRRKARIEIIPLIDIIFFLLATFVMVSLSMVKNQGIKVNLPSAATGVTQEQKTTVTVTVTDKGSFYLNKDELSLSQVISRLSLLKNKDADVSVVINGDRKAMFEDAIGILDEVRRIGITRVTIQTQGKSFPAGGSQ